MDNQTTIIIVVVVLVLGLLIRRIRQLKSELNDEIYQNSRLKDEKANFISVIRNLIESDFNQYSDRVRYTDLLRMISLELIEKHPSRFDKLKNKAEDELRKALNITQSDPEFVVITPTRCLKIIVEPLIDNIHRSSRYNVLKLGEIPPLA